MPIINVQLAGEGKNPDGTTIPLPPAFGLVQRGPILQVVVSLEQQMAQQLLQQGIHVPDPVPGLALIDTGATTTCVDAEAAQKLGLPVVNVVNIASASHTSSQHNVYPIHIAVAGSPIRINAPRAVGVPLAAQGLLVLIGRDVLSACILFYNGAMGSFTLSM